MKSIPIADMAELRQRLNAWCKQRPGAPLQLSMTVGGMPLMVRGSAHLGVRTATCGALLAQAPDASALEQAGRLALGNVALYEGGLALDDASNSLWLSHTLHDPSPQAICSALSALRAQTHGWKRTLTARASREQSSPRRPTSARSIPISWTSRR